jgi:hypothetical protein
MFHLLKVEWLKLKNYRTFWVLTILYVVSIFGINYIVHQIYNNRPKQADMLLGQSPFQFPLVWQTIAYFSSFLLFIPGLLMIISTTNEFSFKTHRQNVIDGWSRSQAISVKMIMAVIGAVFSTLIVFLVALLFGVMEEGSKLAFTNMDDLFFFFVQALSYSAVALVFSLLFRRSGISIGVFFLYVVVIENMFAGLMNHYLTHTGSFLPLESTDALIPFPFFRKVTKDLLYRPDTVYLLVAAAVYLVLYYIYCTRRYKTADL